MNVVNTARQSGSKQNDNLKDNTSPEDLVPVGTFGGSQDFIVRIRNGSSVAANTGDQGGGQN
jgi:hypothetical protein